MRINNRRMLKTQIAIAASIAFMSYSTASACDGVFDDTTNAQGTHDGFYYNFWRQTTQSKVEINCKEDGNFSISWSNVFNWLGGIGWNPGRMQVVKYSGTFLSREIQDSSNDYIMVYARATDPVTELKVIESYGKFNPSLCFPSRRTFGSFQSDGGTYDLIFCQRHAFEGHPPEPKQYFSVRNPPLPWGEVNGTVTIANHLNEWAKHGENLGDQDYIILAIDAYGGEARNSEGYANLSISEGLFDPQKPRCGTQGGVPVCCAIHADPDRDGMGEEDGEVCTVTSATVGAHPDNPPDVLAAINAGGAGDAIQHNGIWYEPSTYVTGGQFVNTRDHVSGGNGNAIFTSELSGDIRSSIPISNQQVSVELSFVETTYTAAGARAFDVTIENQRVLQNVDVFAEAGHDTVWSPSPIVVDVTDGTLNINIDASVRTGTLSSVLVRKSASASGGGTAGVIDAWFLLIMASGFLAKAGRFLLLKTN